MCLNKSRKVLLVSDEIIQTWIVHSLPDYMKQISLHGWPTRTKHMIIAFLQRQDDIIDLPLPKSYQIIITVIR